MNRLPASPPSSGRVSAAVAPCTRDPRIRTDLPVDPRLHSLASVQQTAVVLPTQTKLSSAVTVQQETAMQVDEAAGSGTVENIFDRLLKDLVSVKSEAATTPHVDDSRTSSTATSELTTDDGSAFAVESRASKGSHVIFEETDTIRKSASPRPATVTQGDLCHNSTNRVEEIKLQTSLQRASSRSPQPDRAETKRLDTKHSDTVYDETDGLSHPPIDNRDSSRQSQRRGESKSSRRGASSQDREKLRDGQWTTDARGREKDAGPAAKRMRRERQREEMMKVDSPVSHSSDFS